MANPIDVVEALLFASDAPLEPERIREVLDLEDAAAARALVEELRARYDEANRALAISEVGGGYRFTRSTLLKLSARGDRWWVRSGANGFRGRGGRAIAMQVSQAFDVLEWFERDR